MTTSSKLSSVRITTSLSVAGFSFSFSFWAPAPLLDLDPAPEPEAALPLRRARVISLIFSKAKATIPSALRAPL